MCASKNQPERYSRSDYLTCLPTGLDPAGPLFDSDDYRVRIDEDDALFVDNIHTNAQALGLGKSVAQVDFYPNKGGRQPMCNNGGAGIM